MSPQVIPESQTTATATESTEKVRQKRVFALGNMRFRVSRARICDAVLDALNYALEGFVYLIGPLLIILALGITALLSYVFFCTILPMLKLKHADSSFGNLYLGLHCGSVIFLLVNVLFNYALCVMTRSKGPHYDKLVRELAEATDFSFPETPEAVAQYRRDYEDRMVLRMRRRQARAAAAAAEINAAASAGSSPTSGVTQRRTTTTTGGATTTVTTTTTTATKTAPKPNPPATGPPVRRWMLMTPFEWGYCLNSNQPKPPRSHYDHVTRTLVMNLDHYCPWMFNAIGYFNYRYFVNFLIYIFIGMLYGSLVALEPFLWLDTPLYKDQMHLQREAGRGGERIARLAPMLPFRDEKMLLTLSFMLCMALLFAISLLGGFHLYLTLTAQTTIEFHANWSHHKRARQAGKKWKNPYDQGWRRNWQQVYGTRHWLLAMLPSSREPDFLPVPLADHKGRRRQIQTGLEKGNTVSEEAVDNNIV